MKKLLLCMAVAVATIGNAQQFEVVEIQRIKTGVQQAFHPRFMPDGKTLLVTSEAYDGLAIVDMEKGTYNSLTDMDDAGWLPAISEDGQTILTRCKSEADLSHTVYTLDVATKNNETESATINGQQVTLFNSKGVVNRGMLDENGNYKYMTDDNSNYTWGQTSAYEDSYGMETTYEGAKGMYDSVVIKTDDNEEIYMTYAQFMERYGEKE
jgi:Tol biopolymer transport system component